MNMSSYTPGPWRVGKRNSVVSDNAVPEISGADAFDYYGVHLICESVTMRNARFIAKAPELAEALRELHELAEPFGRHSKQHEQSKQAFARAAALLAEIEA